jgi:hypothetical protein
MEKLTLPPFVPKRAGYWWRWWGSSRVASVVGNF